MCFVGEIILLQKRTKTKFGKGISPAEKPGKDCDDVIGTTSSF